MLTRQTHGADSLVHLVKGVLIDVMPPRMRTGFVMFLWLLAALAAVVAVAALGAAGSWKGWKHVQAWRERRRILVGCGEILRCLCCHLGHTN